MTKLVLIRHGQSTWNLSGRLQGQRHDVPLTELGFQQAKQAAQKIATLVPAGTPIFSSDLLRAQQTAAIVANALGSKVTLDERLREQNLGSMEGKFGHELSAQPTPTGCHISEIRWADGESVADVYQRSVDFLASLPSALAAAVLVGHGDALRILAAAIQSQGHRNIGYGRSWPNAQPFVFEWSPRLAG